MIFIRVDANELIGSGHVMRCLSIAAEFVNRSEEVIFVTADHKGDKLLKGMPTICLGSVWNDMNREINLFSNIIREKKPRMIIVDSYYVTPYYFDSLSKIAVLAYIDDFNEYTWNVDYLINYNIYADQFDYSIYSNTKTKLLLGPEYAPLRKEFKNLSNHIIKDTTNVLVSAGGADPERITERIMDGICPKSPNISFHFVVGALNPRLEAIKNKSRANVQLHINEHRMSELMQYCDLAISAAGTTLYELCVVGIPTITYTLADNQLVAANRFDELGLMKSVGDCRNDKSFMRRLEYCFNMVKNDQELRTHISYQMRKVVDGNGADRIVDILRK